MDKFSRAKYLITDLNTTSNSISFNLEQENFYNHYSHLTVNDKKYLKYEIKTFALCSTEKRDLQVYKKKGKEIDKQNIELSPINIGRIYISIDRLNESYIYRIIISLLREEGKVISSHILMANTKDIIISDIELEEEIESENYSSIYSQEEKKEEIDYKISKVLEHTPSVPLLSKYKVMSEEIPDIDNMIYPVPSSLMSTGRSLLSHSSTQPYIPIQQPKSNVPHSYLCNSELFLSHINREANPMYNHFPPYTQRKQANSDILAARKSTGWRDYVNQGYRYHNVNREEKVRRVLTSINALELFGGGEEGGGRGTGMHFMHNQWFMGPFYSYNHNF